MQDPASLYERDLINMVSRNGAEISSDINTAGVFSELELVKLKVASLFCACG